jgi:hypothetical protein
MTNHLVAHAFFHAVIDGKDTAINRSIIEHAWLTMRRHLVSAYGAEYDGYCQCFVEQTQEHNSPVLELIDTFNDFWDDGGYGGNAPLGRISVQEE